MMLWSFLRVYLHCILFLDVQHLIYHLILHREVADLLSISQYFYHQSFHLLLSMVIAYHLAITNAFYEQIKMVYDNNWMLYVIILLFSDLNVLNLHFVIILNDVLVVMILHLISHFLLVFLDIFNEFGFFIASLHEGYAEHMESAVFEMISHNPLFGVVVQEIQELGWESLAFENRNEQPLV